MGYTKLLEESASVLTDFPKTVVSENGLSMGDMDRMDVIDKMLHPYARVPWAGEDTTPTEHRRVPTCGQKKNDQDRVLSLYGTPGERYW